MRETEKIWMNGELVDWADAKIHVGAHGLHYGTGVFEGIRCYETDARPVRLPARRPPRAAARLRAAAAHGAAVRASTSCAPRLHELIAANGLPECYLRPIAFYGYGELGVSAAGNPVDTVIMSWPWGAYLGEEGLTQGHPREDLLLAARSAPNVIPHVAKATGVYLNSMLAVTRRTAPATTRRSCSPPTGYVADGSGENIFVVKDGVIRTPPLSTSILPGITRDSRHPDRAGPRPPRCEEANLIRSDLYLADEVFMTGTAAEVTPLRSVDDVEIGVGPVTLEIQGAYLDTVRGRSERWAPVARARRAAGSRRGVTAGRRRAPRSRSRSPGSTSARRSSCSRCCARAGSRSGRRSSASSALFAERVGAPYAAAVSSGTAGLHLLARIAGLGPGDEAITSPYSFVASAELLPLRGRDAGVRRRRPRARYNLDPAAVEAAITARTKAVVAVDIFGCPCELDAAARSSASATGSC